MIVFHLLLSAFAGFGGHQTYRVTRRLQNGWSQITCYTVGVLMALPFVVVIFQDLKEIRNPTIRLIVAYFLAYFGFGGGTVMGWFTSSFDGPMFYPVQDE